MQSSRDQLQVRSRVAGYQPGWLDELCLSGEVAWGRLGLHESARHAGRRLSATVPVALLLRRDLAWLLSAHDDAVPEVALDSYNEARGGADRQVRQRAMLYSELELAKWLLHGTELRNSDIVDDAVGLLAGLTDAVHRDVLHPIGAQTIPTLAVDEVESMLAHTERAI